MIDFDLDAAACLTDGTLGRPFLWTPKSGGVGGVIDAMFEQSDADVLAGYAVSAEPSIRYRTSQAPTLAIDDQLVDSVGGPGVAPGYTWIVREPPMREDDGVFSVVKLKRSAL